MTPSIFRMATRRAPCLFLAAVAVLACIGVMVVDSAAAAAPAKPEVAHATAVSGTLPGKRNPGPVVALGAQQFDFDSKITGRSYRLFIAPSTARDPAQPVPVIFVLDGNAYFSLVADALRYWCTLGNEVAPAMVVGIGYPTDSMPDILKRRLTDLTPTPPAIDDSVSRKFLAPDATFGEVDRFLEMIEREVKPLIAAEHPIDAGNSVLFGHSLGGLTVLHALQTRPGSYRSFLALSPSIWWNHRVLLKDQPAFLERVRAHRFDGRVYIGVGSYEEHLFDPPPPGLSAEDALRLMKDARMVGNAREFARGLEDAGGRVRYEELAGHTHISLPWAALRPALELALPVSP